MYEIKVNGLLMRIKPTFKGAMVFVTEKYHACERVTIEKRGIIQWTSEK